MRNQLKTFLSAVPEKTKVNLMLKAFGLTRVPLLFATGARVVEISEESCIVRIPFTKIVKNHLGSMYFGTLAIGADACIGLLAANKIYNQDTKISFVFKSFEAQFLKRAMGPTDFVCDQGPEIDQLIEEAISTQERVHKKLKAHALCQNETVAEFVLELSLKVQS
jgi:acyl-coenzyme A thioesterase PaaI-like protein